jgi:hypothetical protein
MAQSDYDKFIEALSTSGPSNEQFNQLQEFSTRSLLALRLLRWVGWGLLLLALINIVEMMIPLRLMNPVWELDTIGKLVELAPVPLLGFALIFQGESYLRSQAESLTLKGLSWMAFLIGVGFILLIPLGIVNTTRINTQNQEQLSVVVTQRRTQLQTLQTQLQQLVTQAQLDEFTGVLARQGISLSNLNAGSRTRVEIETALSRATTNLDEQIETTRKGQFDRLFKNAVKWNLGALISGILFIGIWKITDWARKTSP